MSIVIAIVVFGIIVVVHEFGHYYAAIKCGIIVEEFSLGMGPRIFSRQGKNTLFSLKLFPIGGSCRMLGEDESNNNIGAFNSKPVWKRMIVIVAGAFLNFVLAVVIILGLNIVSGFSTNVIHDVVPNSPAATAGLQTGDRIIKLNGSSIHIFNDIAYDMASNTGQPVNLTILRGNKKFQKTITPVLRPAPATGYMFGFNGEEKMFSLYAKNGSTITKTYKDTTGKDFTVDYTKAGLLESLSNGFYTSLFDVKVTFLGFVQLVSFKVNFQKDVSGPIGIVTYIGDSYHANIINGAGQALIGIFQFMALLSANLAVLNLLPLPALDGGRLLFLIIEFFRKKPLNPEAEGVIHLVGFILLMILAVFVAYNDIIRIIHH